MSVILKCDVTGSKQDVYEITEDMPPIKAPIRVNVNGAEASVSATINWDQKVKHVSAAAIATALRKAAAQISKAGAREAKPDVPKPAGPVKPPKKAKDTE